MKGTSLRYKMKKSIISGNHACKQNIHVWCKQKHQDFENRTNTYGKWGQRLIELIKNFETQKHFNSKKNKTNSIIQSKSVLK